MSLMQELIVQVRAIRKEGGVEEKAVLPVLVRADATKQKVIEENFAMLERLARVASITFIDSIPESGNKRSTANFDVAIVYEKQVDVAAETARLSKDLSQYEKEMGNADRQLGNEGFLAKAPGHVVEGIRKRRGELEVLIAKANTALESLRNGSTN